MRTLLTLLTLLTMASVLQITSQASELTYYFTGSVEQLMSNRFPLVVTNIMPGEPVVGQFTIESDTGNHIDFSATVGDDVFTHRPGGINAVFIGNDINSAPQPGFHDQIGVSLGDATWVDSEYIISASLSIFDRRNEILENNSLDVLKDLPLIAGGDRLLDGVTRLFLSIDDLQDHEPHPCCLPVVDIYLDRLILDTSGFLEGDSNLDGFVNALDLNALGINWRGDNSRWSHGDFTGDGIVDAADLNVLGVNWQTNNVIFAVAVPEPEAIKMVVCIAIVVGMFCMWFRSERDKEQAADYMYRSAAKAESEGDHGLAKRRFVAANRMER